MPAGLLKKLLFLFILLIIVPSLYCEGVVTHQRRFVLSGLRCGLILGMGGAWAGVCRWHLLSGSEGRIWPVTRGRPDNNSNAG